MTTWDKSKLPSRHVSVGPERAPHRSYYYAMGMTKEEIASPLVGVATCWNEAAPCNIALMRQAQALFAQRLAHFAPTLGVSYKTLRLSSAGTRWGSASADGTIRLNWRLIHLTPEMIDYVVVHELSHLRHMDHSPLFWDVVASVMPDHHERRQALRRAVLPAQN